VTQDLVPAAAATSGADLFSDETLYDPYPLYRELRDRGAAVHMQLLDAWALPRYEEVRAALADWQRYSSEDGVAFNEQMREWQRPTIQSIPPPQHDHVRGS
jgi:cytochrome P450